MQNSIAISTKESRTKMKILFRADSSSTIGIGHIMRDLVLAKQYPEAQIIFASRNLKGNINHKIVADGYSVEILESNDISELAATIQKHQIDMIVLDHYGIDYEFEKKIKELHPNLQLFVLDDTYERHHCDILLNHNISADAKRYKDLVPQHCELRCGAKYTLLREEFIKAKKAKKKRGKKTNIFVAMGGADHSNISREILNVLKNFEGIRVNLVTTTANQNLEKLQKYCKNKKWIELHINSNQIAKLMQKSDFAIVTPSVTINEVYYMGLPFVAIMTADNQKEIYSYLKRKKYPTLKKFCRIELEKKIYKVMKNA